MLRTLKEKATAIDEKGSETSEGSGSNEGYAAGESSSSANENPESETTQTHQGSTQENEMNLLEKTRIWKQRQLKPEQYSTLLEYFRKMGRIDTKINWYRRIGEDESNKPKRIEDFPCECSFDDGSQISGYMKNSWEIQPPTAPAENPGIHQSPAEHSIVCKVRRLCLYFSHLATYFIGEEVNPDLFLYVPPPHWEFARQAMVDYDLLQKTRKETMRKLVDGLKSKKETSDSKMTKAEKIICSIRNKIRVDYHSILYQFLDHLVRPYVCERASDDDSNQKTGEITKKDGVGQTTDESRGERDNTEKESRKPKRERKDKMARATDESAGKRKKHSNTEKESRKPKIEKKDKMAQATDESAGRRKKQGNTNKKSRKRARGKKSKVKPTEEPSGSKRKILGEDTGDSNGKGKHSDQEIGEPESKRKRQ